MELKVQYHGKYIVRIYLNITQLMNLKNGLLCWRYFGLIQSSAAADACS